MMRRRDAQAFRKPEPHVALPPAAVRLDLFQIDGAKVVASAYKIGAHHFARQTRDKRRIARAVDFFMRIKISFLVRSAWRAKRPKYIHHLFHIFVTRPCSER